MESNGVDFIVFEMHGFVKSQFECLQQGSMTVTQYETKFVNLSCYATILIPTKKERVRRFIDGLTYGIRLQMAKETEDDISFTKVAEISRRIENNRGQAREMTSNKRPRYFGGFSGASSGGRGLFGRGHPIRPVQSDLQVGYTWCFRQSWCLWVSS
ncbi:uncharacterized protein [Nicotiana tomentosiformis]|uniref:uncharacterized protein n=1 Tax=Nicotiana tomentosiformis TaxID=4098 RepID=UPI00388CAC6C